MTMVLSKACPILNCDERIDYDHFACKAHWYELPPSLRSKLFHAYAAFRSDPTKNVIRYGEARSAVEQWYRGAGYGLKR